MAQIIQTQTATGQDFDGTTRGVFSFSNYSGLDRIAAIVVDGLHLRCPTPDALAWAEAWWLHPDRSGSLYLGASLASAMLLPSGAAWVARWCPGIVPRLPDGRFFDLSLITSGIASRTATASAYWRTSESAGLVITGGT